MSGLLVGSSGGHPFIGVELRLEASLVSMDRVARVDD
jgi:hypothetical protein